MAKRKYVRKAKAAPEPQMYKVTINDENLDSYSGAYGDPVYFTRATSRQEALTKVLPKFFEEHPSDDIENLQVDLDTETSFVE